MHFDVDPRAHRGGSLAHLAQHFGGVVMEELATAVDLADAFGQGFAFFSRQQFAELFLAGDQLVADGHEHLLAAFQTTGGPQGLSGAGGLDGLAGLFGAGLMVLADQVASVRGAVVAQSGVAFTPLAIDVVVVGLV